MHCDAQHPMFPISSASSFFGLDEHVLTCDSAAEIVALTQNLITSLFEFFLLIATSLLN